MKKTSIFIVLFLSNFFIFAQKAQVIYVEGLGFRQGYTINYDRRTREGETDGLGFRVGVGIRPSDKVLEIPILVNYIRGEKHALEMGLGILTTRVTTLTQRRIVTTPTINVIYRFQAENGLNFRAGWSPIFYKDVVLSNLPLNASNRLFWFTPGISLGWKIK